ncbi:MAG: thiamine pyrophosphate-dependent enzyme [Hymenobacter sp.]
MGVKLADPSREVVVMVGDGSWLMMPSELVTALQEGVKVIVVLVDNHGYASIGSLSRSLGSERLRHERLRRRRRVASADRRPGRERREPRRPRHPGSARSRTCATRPGRGPRRRPGHGHHRRDRPERRRRRATAGGKCRSPRSRRCRTVQAARAAYDDAVTRIRPHLDPPAVSPTATRRPRG